MYFLLLTIKGVYWGLGIGDWGLGIGDWAQSPIPNPQSPFNKLLLLLKAKNTFKINFIKIFIIL
jgi:hypothetical protein